MAGRKTIFDTETEWNIAAHIKYNKLTTRIYQAGLLLQIVVSNSPNTFKL